MKTPENENADWYNLRRLAEARQVSDHATDNGSLAGVDAVRLLHELQVHQIELEMQNEELHRAEEEAKSYSAELAAIYQYAPCIVLLLDAEQNVRKANGFAATFARRSTEELIGRPLCEVLRCQHTPENHRGCGFAEPCCECMLGRTILDTIGSGRVHHQIEVALMTSADGHDERRVFLLSSVPLLLQQKEHALVNILDITERKRVEEEKEELSAKLRQSENGGRWPTRRGDRA